MIASLEETPRLQRTSPSTVVASLEGVIKNYEEVRALRNVNFSVRAGEVVALLGPNGAGKTTAVKLLLGLIQPNSGRARVFGGDPTNPQNRMRTGAMLQVGKVPETLRVGEHIDLFSSYYPRPLPIDEVLAANPKQVEQFKSGKTAVLGFLVGQVMKASRGQANPGAVTELLKSRLGT